MPNTDQLTLAEALTSDHQATYQELDNGVNELIGLSEQAYALPSTIETLKKSVAIWQSRLGTTDGLVVTYLLNRLEDIASSQKCLYDGLRMLLSSVFYPLLESNYIREIYRDKIPPTDITNIAMNHLDNTLRTLLTVRKTPHNDPEWVIDSCNRISAAALAGEDRDIRELASEVPNYTLTYEYSKYLVDRIGENQRARYKRKHLIAKRAGNTYRIEKFIGAAGDGATVEHLTVNNGADDSDRF